MQIIVKTFQGLEEVLAEELKLLGAKNIEPIKRAVSCTGDLKLLYKANLHLRTALRVLLTISTFEAKDEEALYRNVHDFDWTQYIDESSTIAVDGVVFSDHFKHSKYVALKVKDAIVDKFRETTGERPSIDVNNPALRINVHIFQEKVTISLDSSGSSLHMRGYRASNQEAPLNEVLAAGMLLVAGWKPNIPLIDPMCGSGTILMEAGMMAYNMAPAIRKKHFGFMKWRDYDGKLWEQLHKKAEEAIATPKGSINGSDISGEVLDVAKVATLDFKLNFGIRLMKMPFNRLYPKTDHGMLMLNPPYGKRIKPDDINALYKDIGNTLKRTFVGFEAWILSPNVEALKNIGLHPSKKHTLFNGPLECKFQKFEMYEGSKKVAKN